MSPPHIRVLVGWLISKKERKVTLPTPLLTHIVYYVHITTILLRITKEISLKNSELWNYAAVLWCVGTEDVMKKGLREEVDYRVVPASKTIQVLLSNITLG